jgi:hypothetical protein
MRVEAGSIIVLVRYTARQKRQLMQVNKWVT